ncbi:protein FAR1-RELATED SEQUENCE 9-like [Cornus florida]|uniref:protein FAR1-RELATED SEQUENCE 9-like n=1 Tax=Cornus florida TaxID=4283 RepID=UPI00289CC893|nr:protein FAR1-RELATED SEQUENCE 9-like [Cornus florida]
MALMEFVLHYEEQCEKMRLAETHEDFRCKHRMVQPKIRESEILEQAASVYTTSIYYLFEDEFLSSLKVHLEQLGSLNKLHNYRAFQERHKECHIIEYDSSNYNVTCSCKMFESAGWLCRHALKVLNLWNITEIPSQYIIDRWKKCAKDRNVVFDQGELSTQKKTSLTVERNFLLQQAYRAINYLVLSDEGKNVAKSHVQSMWDETQKLMEACNLYKRSADSSCDHTAESCVQFNDMSILDPLRVREKGITNARLKSHMEKKKRKKAGAPKAQTSVKHSVSTFGSSDTTVGHVHMTNGRSFGTPMHANFYNPSLSHEDVISNNPGDCERSRQMLISQESLNPVDSLKDDGLIGTTL